MAASAAALLSEPTPPAILSLEGVTYAIAGKTLLHPLDIDFLEGQSIALVGHNGSGKSTLLKLIARQMSPTDGEIRFGGQRFDGWNARSLARQLAYLPQYTPAAPGMLVRELVALGRYPWHGALGRFGSADNAKVEDAMARTEVEPFASRLVDTLSGGERQRVWLAMLMAQDADCLLLDEPISALDIGHQLDVLTMTRNLSREKGTTIITVLHDINMAARFCDRIVALREGRLIADGQPEEIMTPDVLERIYGVRMDVIRQPDSGRPVALAR